MAHTRPAHQHSPVRWTEKTHGGRARQTCSAAHRSPFLLPAPWDPKRMYCRRALRQALTLRSLHYHGGQYLLRTNSAPHRLLFLERPGQPVEALVQPVAVGRAGRLDVPVPLAQRVQAELVSDLGGLHRIGQVLLVGKHQKHSLAELVLIQHAMELIARLPDTVAIVGVNDKDDTLRVLVVMAPERADLVLAANVPHGERNVFVLDSLDVEADGGDGGDDLAQLELVQDGGLAGRVQTNHQDADIFLAKEAEEKCLGDTETHAVD
mmetsp:Transcript_30103/g.97097  ORF Transcript_30103/g.97097 Transcript_30103/m.97097 type:complete len:265 (-) Transcript_30103:53-847(-)